MAERLRLLPGRARRSAPADPARAAGLPRAVRGVRLPPVNPGSDFGDDRAGAGRIHPDVGQQHDVRGDRDAGVRSGADGRARHRGAHRHRGRDGHARWRRCPAARCASVTVVNVPAFVVGLDVPLEVPEFGTVPVDVVFGGQFFVQARAADLGLDAGPGPGPRPDPGRRPAQAGGTGADRGAAPARTRRSTRSTWSCCTPATGAPAAGPQNAVVLSNGVAARRRPGAPGPAPWTGRRAAPAPAPGWPRCTPAASWRIGEKFLHRSIIGSEFVGELTGTTTRRPVRGGAAHRHRPRLGDRPLPLGAGRHRPVSRRLHRRRHLGPAAH